MASSSSSSLIKPQRKYDLFLSFRGTDTRRGFLSHLLQALSEKKIEAFVDYQLKKGNEISYALLRAIEESLISLIIFSKDYASSRWCLEELVKIVECMEKYGQIVVPIFYDVDPSTVRHQKGSYEDAFTKHERKFKHNIVKRWRTALKKAANLSGFHFLEFQTDAKLVEDIVKCVLKKLNEIMPQSDLKGLVGVPQRIAHLESLLCTRQQNVYILGIWGMGGIGKTTIAGALFNNLCYDYEGCHFLPNVREDWQKYGTIKLRKELLSKLLGDEDLGIDMPIGVPSNILRRLCRKKILLVLDDVDDLQQLQDLTGGHDWFGPGSTIIMTSRDKHVLSNDCDEIYEVKALDHDESFKLFNLHAFKKDCLARECRELSMRVVDYANGIPLAIKVLGSFLSDKTEAEWRSYLEKLEKMPDPKIQNVLKLSYDGLDQSEKDYFLYIACFFKGFSIEEITNLLDCCGLHSTIELRVLKDKALITISDEGHVSMHDLIQEMGRQIAYEESPKDPSKRRHLWDPDDICRVLQNNMGTEAIESISLELPGVKELHLSPQAFNKMVNLKFLKLKCMFRVHISEGCLDSLPEELRYLYWESYPLKSPPSKFCIKNLVQFHMPFSSVERLWDGIQDFVNLKKFDLRHSKCLIELPDLSKASELESVDLSYCTSLQTVHPSILSNPNLVELKLEACEGLQSLESHFCLRSLRNLDIGECSSLKHFSVTSEQMTHLSLRKTAIEELPSSIGYLKKLEELQLYDCKSLKTLPNEVCHLTSLTSLQLSDCCNLTELPSNIGLLSSLSNLALCATNVESLPASIKNLSKLEILHLWECKRLHSLPELPPSIEELDAWDCTSLETMFTANSSMHLKPRSRLYFDLKNCVIDEDAVKGIAIDCNLIIKGVAYKQQVLASHNKHWEPDIARFPGSKVPDCLSYLTRKGLISVTIEVPHNSDLIGFIFCNIVSQLKSASSYTLQPVSCKCYLHINYDERIEYESRGPFLTIGDLNVDHVLLWCDDKFNFTIMSGIKESIASSSASVTEQFPKVSFEFFVDNDPGIMIKECGVYPLYASELHNLFDTKQTKRSRDTDHLQLTASQGLTRMNKKIKHLVLPERGLMSIKLSKLLLPQRRKLKHVQRGKRKSKKLKPTDHLLTATWNQHDTNGFATN